MSMSTRTSRKRKLADTDLVPAEQMNQNPTKRRETTVGMVIDFLEELRRAKHPEKEKKKEVKPCIPTCARRSRWTSRRMSCTCDMASSLSLDLNGILSKR